MPPLIWITITGLALLALNARFSATSRFRWKTRLLTLEFGHWLTLLCFSLAIWQRHERWSAITLAVLALVFLIPAWQASRIAKKRALVFSWARLWFPRRFGREVRIERRTCSHDGGPSLDAVIYTPPGDNRSRRCIIAIHAGGWDSGDPGEFPAANGEIAACNDVVICSIGYRLAPAHAWPAQADDARRGIEWVRAHAAELGIDPDHLILLGRSAGAQIATACAFGMPELNVRRCIAMYGPPDMFFARKWSYPNDILKSLNLVRQYMGGDPEDVPDAYRTASATEFISTKSPPTLLIHGTTDSLVWVEHSRRMHAKMQGVAHSDFLELPWGDHGCDYFPNSPGGQLSLAVIEHFLNTDV